MPPATAPVERYSILSCPNCRHEERSEMPDDACIFFHECVGCGMRLRPRPGDCCVFCSFGSVPCPPKQGTDAGGCCR